MPLGDQLGENLWEYEPDGGCGLRRVLDGLLPYLQGEAEWQHPQIVEISLSPSSKATMRMFAHHFKDDAYLKVVEKMKMRYEEIDFACLVVGEK